MRYYVQEISNTLFFIEVYSIRDNLFDKINHIMRSVGTNYDIFEKVVKEEFDGSDKVFINTHITISCYVGILDLVKITKILNRNNCLREKKRNM